MFTSYFLDYNFDFVFKITGKCPSSRHVLIKLENPKTGNFTHALC